MTSAKSAGQVLYEEVAFELPLPTGPANTYWEDLDKVEKEQYAYAAKKVVEAYQRAHKAKAKPKSGKGA